jgi:hypothetical protein
MDSTRIHDFATGSTRRVVTSWNYARRQPGWVTRATMLAFMLVIAIPVLLLLMLAIAVATVLFFALAGVNVLLNAVRGILPRSDGRQNVVVRRKK